MSRRPPPSSSSGMSQQTRQNEYFVPRDGIDREVITADICRYLGNDALVRPGNYENPDNGQIIQGYFINAYRNLTSAMIQDLKADSARWDLERRQQSANRNSAGGGTIALSGVYIRSSNSPPVQYRNSDIHQSRQYYGPTEAGMAPTAAGGDPYDNPRYPGTGSGGYNGASSNAYQQQQYATSAGGYTQSGYPAQSAQYVAAPGNVAYSASGHVATSGFGQPGQDRPYQIVGNDFRAGSQSTDPYGGNDPYAGQRDPRDARGDPRDQRIPVTTMAASRAGTYTTAGPISGSTYATSGPSAQFYPPGASPNTAYAPSVQSFNLTARSDCVASPAGTTAYSAAPEQQYDSSHAHQRHSGTSQNTQQTTSGSRHQARESVERHTADRHSDSRHGHRAHRTVR
ncbi:hypothetical protein F5Y18DRAFT_421358 [Xylariaceae sp. FL1019]|nr:hypothetical protein F5Y18DRAFT_421358 [Xylariaceae sp. FL1019]